MNRLEILRCPFCGSMLSLEQGKSLELRAGDVINGIIVCQCAAYPIVTGIPVLTTDYLADGARQHLAKGETEQALLVMLGIEEEERQMLFRRFLEKGRNASYREGVEILCPDAEGTYFIYRFSDPTFLIGQTLLGAIGSDPRCWADRAIDLCGGSGHLTRVLSQMAGGAEVWLADLYFWKLWLAKHFTAPACQPVCCDANNPLPFARESFSLAICSDAFHYVWSKRLLASEMMRIVDDAGVILLSHIHNALVENFSEGMALSPRWWRNLFAELDARLFKESEIFESAVARSAVDLSHRYSDQDVSEEAALFLIATRLDGLFRIYNQKSGQKSGRQESGQQESMPAISGVLRFNPLYELERGSDSDVLRLRFPSPEYEEEFGACKRYLPERVEISAGMLEDLSTAPSEAAVRRLIESRILLDLPDRYL